MKAKAATTIYRSPGQVLEDEELPTVKLPFYKRWRLTIWSSAGHLVGTFFSFTLLDGAVWILLAAVPFMAFWALVDWKARPDRLSELATTTWLLSLPRRPDGGVTLGAEAWARRPSQLRPEPKR